MEWMNNLEHIRAQGVGYFLLFMISVIVFSGWIEWRRG